jgi:hypothetical protein
MTRWATISCKQKLCSLNFVYLRSMDVLHFLQAGLLSSNLTYIRDVHAFNVGRAPVILIQVGCGFLQYLRTNTEIVP